MTSATSSRQFAGKIGLTLIALIVTEAMNMDDRRAAPDHGAAFDLEKSA